MVLTLYETEALARQTHTCFCAQHFFSLFADRHQAMTFSVPYPIHVILLLCPTSASDWREVILTLRTRYPMAKLMTVAKEGVDMSPLLPDECLYFTAHYQMRTLFDRLWRLIPQGPHDSFLHTNQIVRGVFFDWNFKEVYIYGHYFDLSLQSIQLLLFLAAIFPAKADADAIANYCNGPKQKVARSSVHVRVSRLNAKIEPFTGRPLVIFLPGEGYTIGK